MKNLILPALLLLLPQLILAQSTVITPSGATNTSTIGDNINILSSSSFLGLYGRRFNGSINSKTPVTTGNSLLTIGAGGYYNTTQSGLERTKILFSSTENWSSSGTGSKIQFFTTQNSTTSLKENMVINHNGNIGIGTENPAARLHVLHNTGLVGDPTVHLFNPITSGLGLTRIRTSTANPAGNGWETIFWNGNTASSNLITLHSKANDITALQLNGNGDLIVYGGAETKKFTKLGEDAPKVKMKELSGTTSNVSGGLVEIVHGLTLSKILAVSIFVSDIHGSEIPPGLSIAPAKYEYYVIANQVRIQNISGSDSQILNRPVRILITYKE